MKRREIWWVSFDPSIGTEVKKTRPAIIISNDVSNKVLSRVQAVPITSKIIKLYPSESIVIINGIQHKAMADQIATVSKVRLKKRIGKISSEEMQNLERVIKLQLELD